MNTKFWLLQALGWLPYGLLQLLIRTEDDTSTTAHALSAMVLSAMAVVGSVGLRTVYRHARSRAWGELPWIAAVIAASTGMAMLVDAAYYAGLWMLAPGSVDAAMLHDAQPLFSRAPLLGMMYVLWSLTYLALSRQQHLQQSAAAQMALQIAMQEAQIQRLLGQLSPHFTFNAINNIRALVLKDPDTARDMLARFAKTLRYQFANADAALVTVEEELSVVRDYLALARMQLGERLQYSERVDPRALSLHVPRFSLQLLVENAIKHGIGVHPGPGQLEVGVSMESGVLQMDVSNSGVLGDRRASTGIGLDNLEQRLRLGFGEAASFALAQEGERVLARIRMGVQP